MKIAFAVFVFALAAFLIGCAPAVSIRPLYTDADLQKPAQESRIEGEWISPNMDKVGTDEELWLKWKVAPPSQPGQPYSTYSVEFRPAKPDPRDGEVNTKYDVRLVPMDGKLFFDADLDVQQRGQQELRRNDILGMVPAHLIGRVWVQQDFLRIALFSSEWVKENSPDSVREMVSIPSKGDEDISVFTSPTDDLRKFVLENSDNQKALSYIAYLCRLGTDCAARGFEDALANPPADDSDQNDMLGDAARFYLNRNNPARAVEILRRLLQRNPRDIGANLNLARALLMQKDFPAARAAYSEAQRLALEATQSAPASVQKKGDEQSAASAAEGLVWTYFLAGDYTGAVTAAAKYKAPDQYASADPILLRYFSLLRMGKRKEAEALLPEQVSHFRGQKFEHLLLLEIQGRIDPGLGSGTDLKGEALQRYYFYQGLLRLTNSTPQNAKWQWQQALGVSNVSKASLPAIASAIELARLKPPPHE